MMNRRRSLRYLVAGTAVTGLVFSGCNTVENNNGKVAGVPEKANNPFGIGRTPEELMRDKSLAEAKFFTSDEMALINVLADIIIPADDQFKAASQTGVAEFIDFMANDRPDYQVPVRGGLQWLNHESRQRFNKSFVSASNEEQIEIVEDIAYPYDVDPQYSAGAKFFSTLRNLVVCGYFSSKEGMACLGYMGNTPNVWDGVPREVLDKHGLEYDQKTLDECIDQSTREEIMDWSGYEL